MEGNSIFSSSTNSSTSSPTNTNFPFSLNQSSTLDHHDYHHDHHGSLMMMMMDGDHPPLINTVHESNHLMMNTHHDDHDHHHGNDNDHHQNKSIYMDNNDNDSNHKLIKKGSTVGKKGKKHRYAFQTRSQVDILDDGYRWRKYGQKAVKNSKFPRSYYRCTYQGCNVKKQVQRLSNDEGVVVTTYEGSHSHSIERSTDNFEHILSQMQIYTS
ncbi:unnamed protein product [Amaranthus hypochondriacus]